MREIYIGAIWLMVQGQDPMDRRKEEVIDFCIMRLEVQAALDRARAGRIDCTIEYLHAAERCG